ncbi:MAG: EamA family transporter [Coriobacteriales bacterium]|jgi:drug/metabolite transporter (DMT)-like permease|nr:EamA family transporter [Coriobacteriales bacterium]
MPPGIDDSTNPNRPRPTSAKPDGSRPSARSFVFLHLIILLYSLAAVCAKLAATSELFSPAFFAWYAGVLVLLGIYALVWQQVIKRMPLTTAFANKGVTVIWGMFWGALLFAEHIDLKMIIGAAVVFAGIVLVVYADA